MITKFISMIILALLSVTNIYSQNSYQIFTNEGFKVQCECKLYENTKFISRAEKQGMRNILAAYICAENEDNLDIGVFHNINIYDESENYKNIQPSDYIFFEKIYLNQYATNLKNEGISYTNIIYHGVSALEYTFKQQGLSTKSIIFIKHKKSYLLQIASKKNLQERYNSLKSSFEIL